MARNRKTQSAAIRFGPAVKAVVLCLLIGGSGVGYVWQKDQIAQLGQQIKKREQRLAQLEDQNEKFRKQLATMRSPAFLEMRIKELNLGLVQPQQQQIWRLAEPAHDLPKPALERQYAAQNRPETNVP
jgi:cell division protein FtsB